MITFKQFLAEVEEVKTDVEDLSPQELRQKSRQLKKMAQIKASGNEERVERETLRQLQQQLRTATDPRQKADLQRRIKEITTKEPEEGM